MASPQLKIYDGDESASAEKLQSIKDRIEAKYAPLIKGAGPLRTLFLRFRMRHELETELNKRAGSLALLLGKKH